MASPHGLLSLTVWWFPDSHEVQAPSVSIMVNEAFPFIIFPRKSRGISPIILSQSKQSQAYPEPTGRDEDATSQWKEYPRICKLFFFNAQLPLCGHLTSLKTTLSFSRSGPYLTLPFSSTLS